LRARIAVSDPIDPGSPRGTPSRAPASQPTAIPAAIGTTTQANSSTPTPANTCSPTAPMLAAGPAARATAYGTTSGEATVVSSTTPTHSARLPPARRVQAVDVLADGIAATSSRPVAISSPLGGTSSATSRWVMAIITPSGTRRPRTPRPSRPAVARGVFGHAGSEVRSPAMNSKAARISLDVPTSSPPAPGGSVTRVSQAGAGVNVAAAYTANNSGTNA